MSTPDCDLEENLEIIQEIFAESIRLNVTGEQSIDVSYHSSSGRLGVAIAYKGNAMFYDGLNRSWAVGVRNKELLNTVLIELQSIKEPIKDQVIEDDFLG